MSASFTVSGLACLIICVAIVALLGVTIGRLTARSSGDRPRPLIAVEWSGSPPSGPSKDESRRPRTELACGTSRLIEKSETGEERHQRR
jgi:hypothetical protein